MAKERLDRAVRRDPLHDRHRLLGRLADPAAGGQRLPRPLPGHPAGLLVPRRVVDRPAARGLQPDPPLRRGPVEVGARRGLGPALDRRRRGPPQPRQLDRLRQRLLDRPRRAGRRLRRRARRPGLRRRDQPRRRALHARRPDDQRLRPAPAAELRRHPARQRRRPVGADGAARRARSRPPSSSTSTRRPAGSTSTPSGSRSAPRPTARRCGAPTAPARSTRPTTSTRSRSSTSAAPTPERSTTPTARGRSAPGSSASTATSTTRSSGWARCR